MPTFEEALPVVQEIYRSVGLNDLRSDEIDDLQNRIRGGQTIDQIIANTRDDAVRRFPPSTSYVQPPTAVGSSVAPAVPVSVLARGPIEAAGGLVQGAPRFQSPGDAMARFTGQAVQTGGAFSTRAGLVKQARKGRGSRTLGGVFDPPGIAGRVASAAPRQVVAQRGKKRGFLGAIGAGFKKVGKAIASKRGLGIAAAAAGVAFIPGAAPALAKFAGLAGRGLVKGGRLAAREARKQIVAGGRSGGAGATGVYEEEPIEMLPARRGTFGLPEMYSAVPDVVEPEEEVLVDEDGNVVEEGEGEFLIVEEGGVQYLVDTVNGEAYEIE